MQQDQSPQFSNLVSQLKIYCPVLNLCELLFIHGHKPCPLLISECKTLPQHHEVAFVFLLSLRVINCGKFQEEYKHFQHLQSSDRI